MITVETEYASGRKNCEKLIAEVGITEALLFTFRKIKLAFDNGASPLMRAYWKGYISYLAEIITLRGELR